MDRVIRFDGCEVWPERRQVLRGGKLVELSSRTFDLLMVFIGQHGRLLNKTVLLNLVWPETVVDDSNVYVQISILRAALGPDIVATVAGRGYRFSAALETGLAVAPAAAGSAGAKVFNRGPELAALATLLERHRLVTVTGPEGSGKTALVMAHVKRHAGALSRRLAWVDLLQARDPVSLPGLINRALGLVNPRVQAASLALMTVLQRSPTLLVLDGAGHLQRAVASLAQKVIRETPNVQICVTSRRPLRLAAEKVLYLDRLR